MTFLPTEHGGREGPAFGDYKPQLYYAGRDWVVALEFPDVPLARPGESVRAFLSFLSPCEHVGKLRPGMAFLIREGSKVVAYGSVSQLLDLESSAGRLAGAK